MPLDFPTSPTPGQIYTFGGRSWQWNGTAWDVYATAANAVTFLNGFTGSINILGSTFIGVSGSSNNITITYTGTGGGGGVGSVGPTGSTGPQGITGPVGSYVISINGLTGVVTGAAFTGTANKFTALQTFTSGICASNGFTYIGDEFVVNNSSNQPYITTIFGSADVMIFGGIPNGAAYLGPLSQSHIRVQSDENIIYFENAEEVNFGGITLVGNLVNKINNLTGNVNLAAGSNITITPSGNTLTIASTASGGISGPYVSSVNGFTGDVAGVAFTGTANTFTQLQSFTVGTSSAAYILGVGGITSFASGITLESIINGEVLLINSGTATTVRVPTGLPVGYSLTIIQLGTGAVGITSNAGVTLNSYSSYRNLAGQHASASLLSYASDVFNLSGALL